MASQRIVVIGGSAAGPKTAAKARRMDQEADVTIIQKDADFSMASCGYPYYVGGVFDNRNLLISTPTGVVRDSKFFLKVKGINAIPRTEVTRIDRAARKVYCRNLDSGEESIVEYDKLVIATGSTSVRPPLPGSDLEGITTLYSLRDADMLRKVRDEGRIKKAVIIGGGLIGVETCEALQLAGIHITVIELLPQLLMFLDWQLAKLLENHVRSKGADVITENPVAEFLGEDGKLVGVKLRNGTELPCELAVVAVGVRPNAKLAAAAGIDLGPLGGIRVNEYMQTSDPNVYAVGDCVECRHIVTGKPVYAPLGDLANLQGRVAGQNVILGNRVKYPGTISTGVCRVFDYTAGSTGLTEKAAREAGFDPIAAISSGPDKPDYMGPRPLIIKLIADRKTGRLLGMQGVGPGDLSKRIAIAAMAIAAGQSLSDLAYADLPYAPPFSPALDPIITAAHVLENKMMGRMDGITAVELKKRLDAGEKIFMLDVRGPDEYETMRLGIGETLIPLGALRTRLAELPQDKNAEIVCFCKISLRGYEAAGLLAAQGWKNLKVLEGGVIAWPYAREK